MNENKTMGAIPLLLLVALLLSGCQVRDVPRSLAAMPQWVAFTFLDDGEVSTQPLRAQPAAMNPSSETDLEVMIDGVQLDVVLREGMVYVYQGGMQVWRSDPSWNVREMLPADVDNDGGQEVAFVLWKPFVLQPRFLYEDFRFEPTFEEGSLRNHLFLYGWRDGKWRPLWSSSPIADPIRELAVGDIDGDGANELVVLEGSYGDALDEPARRVTLWRWNGWGFTLHWRGAPGRYRDLILQDVTSDEVPDIVLQRGF